MNPLMDISSSGHIVLFFGESEFSCIKINEQTGDVFEEHTFVSANRKIYWAGMCVSDEKILISHSNLGASTGLKIAVIDSNWKIDTDLTYLKTKFSKVIQNPGFSPINEKFVLLKWNYPDFDQGMFIRIQPRILMLENFDLISPTNDETINSSYVQFLWHQPSRYKKQLPSEIMYSFSLLKEPGGLREIIISGLTDTVFSYGLLERGTYYWKVSAYNAGKDSILSNQQNWAFFASPHQDRVFRYNEITKFKILSNFPNPFNPTTTISFHLPTDGFVILKIYDITGRLVRVLVQEQKLAGSHSILWDGLDDAGQKVAAGVYLYRIEFVDAAGEKLVMTKKMSLVK